MALIGIVRRSRGYTLVEVMIVVAIIGIMALIGPRLFLGLTRYFRMNSARHEIQRDSRNVLEIINRNLRQAESGSLAVSQQTGQPPYSKISFDKFITTSTARSMSFYQSGETLYQVDNGSTRALCGNLRYIAFSYPRTDDATIISISLTLEKATFEGKSKALHLAVEKVRIMND